MLFFLFLFLTLVFSLTTFLIIVCYWRQTCRSIVNLLICNSCLAQLLCVISFLVQIPLLVRRFSNDAFEPNQTLCKGGAAPVTISTSAVSSACLIQAISRFFITVLYQHRFLCTFASNWILIVGSWFYNIIIAILLYHVSWAYQYESETSTCTPTAKNFSSAFTLCMVSSILSRTTRGRSPALPARGLRRNQTVFRNIFIYISIVSAGGIPYLICIIVNRLSQAPQWLYLLSLLFVALAIAANSIALLIMNHQVRKTLVQKFNRRQRFRREAQTIEMRTMEIAPNGH